MLIPAACNSAEPVKTTENNMATDNHGVQNQPPLQPVYEGIKTPEVYSAKGRFCILLYGDSQMEKIKNMNEQFMKKIDRNITDYYFIDLSRISETERAVYDIDFPSQEGLMVFSASRNLLLKYNSLSNDLVDTSLNRIKETYRLFTKNNITLSDFSSFEPAEIFMYKDENQNEKPNFYEMGTFNNILNPSDFVNKGKVSVLVFSTIGCKPCKILKKSLFDDEGISSASADFYYVNHNNDNHLQEHGWDELKQTKALKIYAIEGMTNFPTVWIVSPTGTIFDVVDAYTAGGTPTSLYEYIKKTITELSAGRPVDLADKTKKVHDNNKSSNDVAENTDKKTKNSSTNKGDYIQPPVSKNETSAGFVSINKLDLSSNNIQIYYNTEKFIPEHTVEIIIEDPKGKQPAIKLLQKITPSQVVGNSSLITSNALNGLKKKTQYYVSLKISFGKNSEFKISQREVVTDKNVFLTIII